MPYRILRDGIIGSERVDQLSWSAEVFYRRLHSVVDDYGRYYARPSLLRASCYPLKLDRVSDADIGKWLTECVTAGLVSVYQVSGKEYLEVQDFRQQIRAKQSKYPSKNDALTSSECVADAKQVPADAKQVPANAYLGVSESECVVPKATALGAPDGPIPDCPHVEIIKAYHELLPTCPRVLDWTDKRCGYLRSRWREKAKPNGTTQGYASIADGIAWWRMFFGWCAESKFLTGGIDGRDGKAPFVADLEWIVKPSNFVKISEGKYHR